MKTTQQVLEDLYDKQVEAMQLALKDPGSLGAATLNVIRQFLKDAGIQSKPTKGSALGNLADSLPHFDAEDDGISPPHSH